jgi:hypothetical protein
MVRIEGMSKHGITVEMVLTIPKVEREAAEKVVALLDRWETDRDFTHEDVLQAADELLGTCGVEALAPEGADHYRDEGIRMCPPFSYCNAGDPYIATLIRDHEKGAWLICGWGDALEAYEKEHKLGDHEEFEDEPEECPSCGASDFTLKSFVRGEWEGGQFITNGTGYAFVCQGCNHHCQTPEDFTPPEPDENGEDEDPEGTDDNHNHQ